MKNYDRIDEAVIEAPPAAVWEALISEFRGAARWWVPHNTYALLSGSPDEVGGEVEVTVHTRGADRGGLKLRFVSRTRSVEPDRMLAVEYVSGVFRGPSEFWLTPLDDGARTRLAMHFRGRPHGWLRLLSGVAPLDREHSAGTQAAFAELARRLAGAHGSETGKESV
ncbi:SRPBCC family protein [Streptomonospora litoralis]|uniref:Polyketide cyclase / dehydrase and lipid transport n=1 Tax=Streptomonospora litoralis TaxID=2498135 RepID=A0A4P6Q300_9ACTN|nr:SRPBCC family protein [Streptomonospora litoralis]QBI54913.1 Polyketide cyclase / dehydrase and lipid transport [Streptomonospora litoralis]